MREWIIFVLVVELAAGYITSVACRVAHSRRKRVGWHHALLGMIGADLLIVLAIGGVDLFRPSHWDQGKVSIWYPIFVFGTIGSVIGIGAAGLVLTYFERRFGD